MVLRLLAHPAVELSEPTVHSLALLSGPDLPRSQNGEGRRTFPLAKGSSIKGDIEGYPGYLLDGNVLTQMEYLQFRGFPGNFPVRFGFCL